MRITFEPEDLDAIANRVVERLTPLLKEWRKEKPEDTIFSVDTLAEYLRVKPSTVYNWVHLKKVPYFKTGKYTRFQKSAIDRWLDEKRVEPGPRYDWRLR